MAAAQRVRIGGGAGPGSVPWALRRHLLVAVVLTLLWARGATVPGPAAADELVVDNVDPSVQVRGTWAASGLTDGFRGEDYRFRMPGDGTATVFWPFPSGAPAGRYEVFASWTSGPNRAGNAPYTVAHADGTAAAYMNQRVGGGAWQSFGSFTFQAGLGEGVSLSNKADGVVIADAVRWVGPLDSPQPSTPPPLAASPAESPELRTSSDAPSPSGPWTVTFRPAPIHAGPDASTHRLGELPQFTFLQVRGYAGGWAYVYNPRAGGTGYVPSDSLGPAEAPPAYVTAPPPPPLEPVNRPGRTVGEAPLAYYPVVDPWVYERRLGHNAPVYIEETVRGEDGKTWYRTSEGGYLQRESVRLPPPPPRTFPGRWIDVDLTEPAILTAYEDDRPVRTTLVLHGTGRWQTPLGVFRIQRRVASETMDSQTIGIPRQAPGGYYLENVRFTQYFLPTGESLHHNYWSSNWGYGGSHGCLGLTYADAAFLWDWATLGTPISIHR